VNTVDGCGWPSLHRAALSFDVKTVLTVLEYGAPVNMRGPEGRTALMIASQWGHCKMIRTLLKAGASIGTADESGLTALMYAAKEGQEAAAHLLLQNGVCLPPNIF